MMIALLGVAVFAGYVQFTPAAQRVSDELRRQPTVVQTDAPRETSSVHAERSDEVLIPVVAGEDVSLRRPMSKAPEGVDPRVHAVTQTFQSLGIQEGRAVGIRIERGTAYVDINDAVVSHGFGSMEEGQLLKALQLVLGQFKEIEQFRLVNDGSELDTLGGHIDLLDPVRVVRPGEEAAPGSDHGHSH